MIVHNIKYINKNVPISSFTSMQVVH